MPYDVNLEDVKEIYAKYGEVKDAFLPMDKKTNRPRGFAFVTLDKEVAEKAIEETNGMDFMGRGLTVSMPLPPGEKPVFEKRERKSIYWAFYLFFIYLRGCQSHPSHFQHKWLPSTVVLAPFNPSI